MLTQFDAQAESGAALSFPILLGTGYQVLDIEGLDPVKAVIVTSSFAQQDGSLYQSSRRESRTLTIKIKLKPDEVGKTVSQLRQELMTLFMTKSAVTLFFQDEEIGEVWVDGRVETFDCPRFVKEPTATITVLCFDGDFKELAASSFNGFTRTNDETYPVFYRGTVETGMRFQTTYFTDINELFLGYTIEFITPDGMVRSLRFDNAKFALQDGDLLEISSIPRQKGAWVIRAGVRYSVLYAIDTSANWVQFFNGTNQVRVVKEGLGAPYTIEYLVKYGGL